MTGKSILEMLWEELESKLDALQADGGEPHPDGLPNYGRAEFAEWGRQQGRCEGLAFAIAVMTNPYAPDVPAIKEEAMRRWESANETVDPDRPKRTGKVKTAGRTVGARRTRSVATGRGPAADS